MACAGSQRPGKLLGGGDPGAGMERREQSKYRAKVFGGREGVLEADSGRLWGEGGKAGLNWKERTASDFQISSFTSNDSG